MCYLKVTTSSSLLSHLPTCTSATIDNNTGNGNDYDDDVGDDDDDDDDEGNDNLVFLLVTFLFCSNNQGAQRDFPLREHVQNINFKELLHQFKTVQQKHFINKHSRSPHLAKNLLSI